MFTYYKSLRNTLRHSSFKINCSMSCIYSIAFISNRSALHLRHPFTNSPQVTVSHELYENQTCLSFTSHVFTEVPFLQQDYLNNATFNTDNHLLTLTFRVYHLKRFKKQFLKPTDCGFKLWSQ